MREPYDPGIEALMHRAALAVSSVPADNVFPGLVRALADLLDAEMAFIALRKSDDPSMLSMLAFYYEGAVRENFEYPIAGTPCETVVGREYRAYPTDLCTYFPHDTDFARLGLTSYAGYPLNDGEDPGLGLMSVVSRKPITSPHLVESIVKIFAVRASAELERERAETALRQSEESYRAIFEAGEDPIFVHDWETGEIVDANPKASAVYGWSCDELRKLTVGDFSSGAPPYTDADARRWLGIARQGGNPRFEWHRRNRDGSLHWDEVSLKSAWIGGKPRIIAVSRDITRRKLAEEALKASEEQYRAIFNVSLDAINLWDADLRMIDANPAYFEMYGYARDEVIGKSFPSDLPEDYVEARRAILRRTLAGESCQLETMGIRRGGEPFIIEVRTIPVRYRGAPHAIAIARDITERKAAEAERAGLERQLRQAQKMEAIGHVAGGIAHDFNNILTGILGYVVLAAEREAAAADPKIAGYLEQAQASCRRARDLIQQLLTFSRGRPGERRPLSLPAVVNDATALVRSAMPSTLELETVLDPVPEVVADRVQLEQILLNLCINARDALGGTGRVTVGVRRAPRVDTVCTSCRARCAGAFVELWVRDRGPGIAPEIVERIFEPFFSTKEIGKGTGMGLSVVHGIVHEHLGHVIVESAAGRGATFRILLPEARTADCAEPPCDEKAGAACAVRPPLRGRVLVVDDEPAVAVFMRDLLESWGLHATTAPGAHAALDALRITGGEAYDLVITDQTMPRMSGVQLAREIARLDHPPPVVIYTGYADGMDSAELRRAGIEHLVRKPIEPAELRAVVSTYVARPRTER